VLSIIILAPRAPIFAAVLFVFAVVYMVSGVFVTRRVRNLMGVHASSESRQTGYLADSITNIMAIKSFSGTRFENKSFEKYTDKTRSDLLSIMRANNKQMLFFSIMNRSILVCALILAIVGVAIFDANIATVFLIFSFTSNLIGQLWVFCNNALRTYSRAFGDAQDMVKILAIESEIKDPEHAEKPRISKGLIEFNDVMFSHEGMPTNLFENLDLTINAGEKVGIVGHSGSGKTTFTRLLLRFSDIDSGEILIDGQNISHITQDDLHASIAYVPQEPIMFHRSLRDNIRYGNFKASEADIKRAAQNSHAAEFIADLPEGYETLVGERGVKLSGGQRQRIAIARAMIKDAPILLLDEATSALDSESESLIQDALKKLMQGRTTIVIAHRLSTIQKLDRIIVLEEGKIIEEGSHKDLLEKDGVYAKLWNHQSGGFIEE
jgi:ATP-binding cassette subfamily B protein